MSRQRIEVEIEPVTGEERETAGSQNLSQAVDNPMGRVLCTGIELKHRKHLGEGIDGQPQPQHLVRTPQPGAQFVQLEVWEPEMAEGALVQGLCVLAGTGQPGGVER